MKKNSKKNLIPIFFAVDDNYAPYLAVALRSLIDNSSKNNFYDINILVEAISERHEKNILAMQEENVKISFCNVKEKVRSLCSRLHLRDYYTRATYYRFFIPELFPEFDKGLYLDCDIAITRDVADMYNTPIGKNLVGAMSEEVMTDIDVFGRYSETVLGVDRFRYFNAGILVMNLYEMRKMHIEEVFASLLTIRTYSVAQDQDYLNVICRARVRYLNVLWNKTPMPYSDPSRIPFIAHYKINFKPWKYDDIVYGDLFWKYAEKTPYFDELKTAKTNYTDAERYRDQEQYLSLERLADSEIEKEIEHRSQTGSDDDLSFAISGLDSLLDGLFEDKKARKAEAV